MLAHMTDPLINWTEDIPLRFSANLGEPSIYKGLPRQELDDAWEALVDRMFNSPRHVPLYMQALRSI